MEPAIEEEDASTTVSTPNSALTASIDINAVEEQSIILNLLSSNTGTFANRTYTLTYDAQKLQVSDLLGQTYAKELTAASYGDITITSVEDGEIQFTLNKEIPSGQVFTGFINQVKFVGITSGVSTITLQVQ